MSDDLTRGCSMKTITFIRHGQSVANAGGVTMEHGAIPLSELGNAQARALAAMLERSPSQILASSYVRAQETARPFCEKVSMGMQLHPLLHEFSTFDPALLEGMNGAQRQPLVEAYWQEADPARRMGEGAETFAEFDRRVGAFLPQLQDLPDGTVLFGHGMWMALLIWKLLGFRSSDSLGMKAFRRFQLGLPIPNCAVYHLKEARPGHWHPQADEGLMRKLLAVSGA